MRIKNTESFQSMEFSPSEIHPLGPLLGAAHFPLSLYLYYIYSGCVIVTVPSMLPLMSSFAQKLSPVMLSLVHFCRAANCHVSIAGRLHLKKKWNNTKVQMKTELFRSISLYNDKAHFSPPGKRRDVMGSWSSELRKNPMPRSKL